MLLCLAVPASLAACSSSPSTTNTATTTASSTTTTTVATTGNTGGSTTTTAATTGNTGGSTTTTAGGSTAAAPTSCSDFPGSTLSALGGTWSSPTMNNVGTQIICLYQSGSNQATLTFTPNQSSSQFQGLITAAEGSGQMSPSSVTPLQGVGQQGFQTSATGYSPAPDEVWVLTASGLAISLESPGPLATVISIVKTLAAKY